MKNINALIIKTLEPIGIPVYFASRKEVDAPLILFNVTGERGLVTWEDEEMITKYRVTINLFAKGNFIPYKNQIMKLMKQVGFKRTDIPECMYFEDIETFNQPIFFEYIHYVEDDVDEILNEETEK